jgi:CheY-like chemotaxis protein
MQAVYLQRIPTRGLEGDNIAKEMAITRFPTLIGRFGECDQRLNHPFISRRHCSFFVRDNRVWVQDLGSRNGTHLNGERVRDAQPLHDGDRLDLGPLAFQVRLHVGEGEPSAVPSAVAQGTQAAGPPRHVLVVEDNRATAETLAMLLKGWGHNVEVAHDGPAAIQAAQAHQPDTVLLDIRSPGIDGYQVAQQLRKQPGCEAMMLVAIIGEEQDQARGRSQEVDFDEMLTKPVNPAVLREVLRHSSRT